MPDSDLAIRRGGSHPDPSIRGGAVSKKIFSILRASMQFGLKNKMVAQAPPPPRPLPWIRYLVCAEF